MRLLRDFWRLILIGIGLLVLLAACGGVKLGQLASEAVKPADGRLGASLSMSLHTVPTVRSVTVSPEEGEVRQLHRRQHQRRHGVPEQRTRLPQRHLLGRLRPARPASCRSP